MTAEAVRAAADALQVVVLVVIVVTLLLTLEAGRRWPAARKGLAGLVTLGVHGVLFYVFALAGAIPAPFVSLWSAGLRLHSSVFILALLVVFFGIARRHGWPPAWWPADDDKDGHDDR